MCAIFTLSVLFPLCVEGIQQTVHVFHKINVSTRQLLPLLRHHFRDTRNTKFWHCFLSNGKFTISNDFSVRYWHVKCLLSHSISVSRLLFISAIVLLVLCWCYCYCCLWKHLCYIVIFFFSRTFKLIPDKGCVCVSVCVRARARSFQSVRTTFSEQ